MERNELSELPLLRRYDAEGIAPVGLDEEIRERMRSIESPDGSPDQQVAQDYERLASVLEEAQPQLAARMAGRLGRHHGRDAALQWQQEALDGAPTAESVALARRVLLGVQQGDESAFDVLPGPSERYMASGLAADCGWPEPDVEDRLEHHRWDVAQFAINDAYEVSFTDALFASVAEACRNQITQAAAQPVPPPGAAGQPQFPTRPILRPAGASGPTPDGWETIPAGRNSRGHDLEAVYDPRRFDVMVIHGEQNTTSTSKVALEALGQDGWTRLHSDDNIQFFWRDRMEQVRAALGRSTPNPGTAIEGPGL